jgi:hypothetical protein
LFWTYLVPVLPLVLLFDVVVSLLRIYSEPELRDLTAGLDHYQWNIGKVRGKWLPFSIPYLIGVPVEKGTEPGAADVGRHHGFSDYEGLAGGPRC